MSYFPGSPRVARRISIVTGHDLDSQCLSLSEKSYCFLYVSNSYRRQSGTAHNSLDHCAQGGQFRTPTDTPLASMKHYKIPNTDLAVSRIAYGCANLLGWDAKSYAADALAKASRSIHCAYDSGITLFDQADTYGFGRSERALGEILRQSPGLRNKVVLQTKSGMDFSTPDGPYQLQFNCSYQHLINSVEGSLSRLGTDRLDVLLLHWSDALVEPEEVAKAFDELKRSGKVRYFGVSNHTPGQIDLLKKFLDQPIVINQVRLSLGICGLILEGFSNTWFMNTDLTDHCHWPGVTGTLDYCRTHDIQIQAYSPLRGGLLNPPTEASPQIRELSQGLADIAQKENTKPATLALAWLLRHPANIVPVVSSTNIERLRENCAADHLTVSRDDWYTLLRLAALIKRDNPAT